MDDTDWEDIGKRVSKQIKVTDGRIIYTPENNMDDDSDPTASSSRDKRASGAPEDQATISKTLKRTSWALFALVVLILTTRVSQVSAGPNVDLVEIFRAICALYLNMNVPT